MPLTAAMKTIAIAAVAAALSTNLVRRPRQRPRVEGANGTGNAWIPFKEFSSACTIGVPTLDGFVAVFERATPADVNAYIPAFAGKVKVTAVLGRISVMKLTNLRRSLKSSEHYR